MNTNSYAPTITPDMKVADIVNLCPVTGEVMAEYGLHCYSCDIGGVESLTEGCTMHGFDEDMINALVEDLNDTLAAQPKRPQHVTITEPAAKALQKIANDAKNTTEFLAILSDDRGGFCLEFRKNPLPDEQTFTAKGAAKLTFCVSSHTLWQIGGSVIDYRDDVLKLDLYEVGTGCCGGNKGECGCK